MLKSAKTVTSCIFFTIALVAAPVLEAQQAKWEKAPPAPVPAPILTSKKAFISNAGGDVDISPDHYSGGRDRAYNQFYAAIKGWGRYELVPGPCDADLILELHFTALSGAASIFSRSGGVEQRPQFILVILDLKTHAVLWSFTEYLDKAKPHSTHDQQFDQAIDRIADDLKDLASRPAATADGEKK